MHPIYLDHNATSPLNPHVFEAMRPHWFAPGNSQSRHASGRAARRALITATETVARILNAHPDEIVFTSGGTEANNLAIFGLARSDHGPGQIVTTSIEHPAVAAPLAMLEMRGHVVNRVNVSSEGLADPAALAAAAEQGTRLTTLMLANNETGAIQPVARLVDELRGRSIPVHTDAAQAVGRIAVDFCRLGVTTLAASAHKFGGPPGVGVLLVRNGWKLEPWLLGGGQQQGIRPGTVPVPLVVGLAAALEWAERERPNRNSRLTLLCNRLETTLVAALGPERVVRNGPARSEDRLPQTINLGFPHVDGDLLLMKLDQAGVHASLGSACASGTTTASPALRAMGVPASRIRSSVRFSLGPETTEAEIDEAARRILRALNS
jgi:cysteine desulfurase